MKRSTLLNCCLLLGLLSGFCPASVWAQEKFAREALLADADSLYAGIRELHPNMFAFISKECWEEKLRGAKSMLADSATVIDFYKTMAPLVVRLGDGHTGLSFPKKALADAGIGVFPLVLRFDKRDKNAYLKGVYNGQSNIPSGAKITDINGIPTDSIINNLIGYISGEQESFRLEVLEYHFPMLFTLLCRDSLFDVQYEWNHMLRSARIPACPVDKINYDAHRLGGIRGYSLAIADGHVPTAVLTLDRCDVELEEYDRFLDSCFTGLRQKGISRLIVDIRNNGGGDSRVADELFEYISPCPFIQCDKMEMKISNKIKQCYKFLADKPDGIETVVFDPVPLKNYPNRFEGEVFLLTSGYTFSAAADLAWAFKHYRMGTIIGEQTGGLGVCFGDSAPLRLPHTQLGCGVSWKKFYNVGATDDSFAHGVIPDIEISGPEALDFALKSPVVHTTN